MDHPSITPHKYELTRSGDGNSGTYLECRHCGYGPAAHGVDAIDALWDRIQELEAELRRVNRLADEAGAAAMLALKEEA